MVYSTNRIASYLVRLPPERDEEVLVVREAPDE